MTSGTNHPDTRSASRWIGARERCACATICTIFASMVSRPIFSARIVKLLARYATGFRNGESAQRHLAYRARGIDAPA
jgi:hypothetical protein